MKQSDCLYNTQLDMIIILIDIVVIPLMVS